MIDLSAQIAQAQIAAFLGIIAIVLVYLAFGKKSTRTKNKARTA